MTLTKTQLRNLTGKVRFTAMRKELLAMGIPFTLRRDGYPVVFQSDLNISKPTQSKSWDLSL